MVVRLVLLEHDSADHIFSHIHHHLLHDHGLDNRDRGIGSPFLLLFSVSVPDRLCSYGSEDEPCGFVDLGGYSHSDYC